MNCPTCSNSMVHAQATAFGSKYWYCRTCKKELDEMKAKTSVSDRDPVDMSMSEALAAINSIAHAPPRTVPIYGARKGIVPLPPSPAPSPSLQWATGRQGGPCTISPTSYAVVHAYDQLYPNSGDLCTCGDTAWDASAGGAVNIPRVPGPPPVGVPGINTGWSIFRGGLAGGLPGLSRTPSNISWVTTLRPAPCILTTGMEHHMFLRSIRNYGQDPDDGELCTCRKYKWDPGHVGGPVVPNPNKKP